MEDENRELVNKLEFARENVKVLKRGYAEKIDDLQRKLDEKDQQLQGIRQEVLLECDEQVRIECYGISLMNW